MHNWTFDNRYADELPGDPDPSNQRRQVHGALWSAVTPTPVAAPKLLAWSAQVASLLDLDPAQVRSDWFTEVFAGNRVLPGMHPIATNYGGHQFGNWAGQLGDGRAISLGELVNRRGERWELQLKGAGPTPYSRTADGRAVLRSSLREFVCSEAMHHLGVPTTRALSLISTGERVVRDMFYDGNPVAEPGAVVCRVAPSFIRLGHFELPAARGDTALLERLVDFTIARDFAHLQRADFGGDLSRLRAAWFVEVCERTALLIAHWMRVGFVHGVMNTDNLSVLGLTIDYGPYGWLDDYDPDFTPNTTDAHGRRYRYAHQPAVGHWNLSRFAGALTALFDDPAPLHEGLAHYRTVFEQTHRTLTQAKFGLSDWREGDQQLVDDGFALLQQATLDFSLFFRCLSNVDPAAPSLEALAPALYHTDTPARFGDALNAWLARWVARVADDGREPQVRKAAMDAVNPRFVARNWLAQQAIDAASAGDLAELNALLDVLRTPYAEQPEHARFAQRRPEWARNRAGCSMLSCSS